MSGRLNRCINIRDFQLLARQRLPRPIIDFLDGGAEDEKTLAANRAAFDDWALLPVAMNDVSRIDASATVLGQSLAWPFVVGPTGMPGLLHPDGELGIARAAESLGAMYTLSTMGSRSIEEVAAATNGPKAFQLYLFRDRGMSLELLQRAKAAGYNALILTVDVQVPANRERDRRSGMLIPPKFNLRSLVDFALHPAWCWNVLIRRPVTLANFSGRRADPRVPLLTFINQQFDPSISWSDMEWVASHWGGPFAIKGILSPDDASRACDHGASAVVVSNHGGRQLDGEVSPLQMLPEIVAKVGGRAEIILDGGIRRGTDMLKAVALGATACMAGRVGLYGLGAGGSHGAAAVLRALRTEFERDLALLGTTTVAQVDRGRIRAKAAPVPSAA
jgi:L-lactate dehydrogenase (cytochrome)